MTESIQTTADTAAAKDLRAVYAAPTLTELCLQKTENQTNVPADGTYGADASIG